MLQLLSNIIAVIAVTFVILKFLKNQKRKSAINKIHKTSKSIESQKDLKNHTKIFEKRIVKIKENVYVAIGYAIANCILVIGEDGVVIIDTTESNVIAQEIMKEFKKITQKKVKAIILTHFHTDHIRGIDAVLEYSDDPKKCQIWAHSSTTQKIVQMNTVVGPIAYTRACRQFGSLLGDGVLENAGIGNKLQFELDKNETANQIFPTHTIDKFEEIKIAGINLQLIHAPGETDDQIVVFMPKEKILFAADNFYESFPNLYAIRGVPFRSPKHWYESVDLMKDLMSESMVPSHGPPVLGKENVLQTLTNYRDGIQFVHDQSVYHMIKGEHPDEYASKIILPPSLIKLEYLKQFYGTTFWSAKSVFCGYMGFYSGEVSELFKLAPSDYSKRMAPLIGLGKLKQEIQDAMQAKEFQWALELSTIALLNDPSDQQAKNAKIAACMNLAQSQISAPARNYFLTSALELEGKLILKPSQEMRDNTIKYSPLKSILESMSYRVKVEDALNKQAKLNLQFTDINENYTLELRNCVLVIHSKTIENSDIIVKCLDSVWRKMLAKPVSIAQAMMDKEFQFVKGNLIEFRNFMDIFDKEI